MRVSGEWRVEAGRRDFLPGTFSGYCYAVDENNFGVPAGWYPDPLGLPQLRWWDSQAWTEHTSEARAPIIIQPATTSTRLGYADDDITSRLGFSSSDEYSGYSESSSSLR